MRLTKMEQGEMTFSNVRNMSTNIASLLVKLGHREEADILSILVQIIGYRVGDNFSDDETALQSYLLNCQKIKDFAVDQINLKG